MRNASPLVENQVKAFCARIGADPLLVQGPGGNVSWKDGDLLWVKASGTWLAEAEAREIFVPVNLEHLKDALSRKQFLVTPQVKGNSALRPSIETLLHALMPHTIVVHLHAVEILSHLVRVDPRRRIDGLVGDSVKSIFVDYFKPGADLARAISADLDHKPDADVVFMANHGVVIGGASIDDIVAILRMLMLKLRTASMSSPLAHSPSGRVCFPQSTGYVPCADQDLNVLALKGKHVERLRHEWALYPDHVVFLGAEAVVLERDFSLQELNECVRRAPPFIFAVGDGVFESAAVTPAQRCQLRCYLDVLSRQGDEERLCTLNESQVSELLDWDAEKHRQGMPDGERIALPPKTGPAMI